MMELVSPPSPLPGFTVAWPPVSDESTDWGRSATASQSLPTTYALSAWPELAGFLPLAPSDCCSTFAPAGGVNAKLAAAGLTNETEVKPIWPAEFFAPLAKICTRSGTSLAPSTAMRIWPTRDWELFG